jgi:prephenate dehydrogenase
MAGSEKHGPGASDPYLFQNAIYVITPVSGETSPREKQLGSFLNRYLGCRQVFMDPITHDTIAATVSHIPHILSVSLVNLAQRMEDKLPGTIQLAAGGFRDMTRIASSPYTMWHDIFLTNKTVIEPLLDKCIDELTTMKQLLRDGMLQSTFEQAVQTRKKIPLHNKGFLSPLFEILVIARDQPGFIASLSGILAENNINIKDFEVMKMREGEGGTFRLAFDSTETARAAIALLNSHGFSARERN